MFLRLFFCGRTAAVMMLGLFFSGVTGSAQAVDQFGSTPLSAEVIVQKVQAATAALNAVSRSGATAAEAKQLFALYTADFVYQHDKYGGIYSREQLYRNTLRMIQNGGDHTATDRYQLLQILPGEQAAAVLRLTRDGQQHLSVFEFSGDKISKIKEYW